MELYKVAKTVLVYPPRKTQLIISRCEWLYPNVRANRCQIGVRFAAMVAPCIHETLTGTDLILVKSKIRDVNGACQIDQAADFRLPALGEVMINLHLNLNRWYFLGLEVSKQSGSQVRRRSFPSALQAVNSSALEIKKEAGRLGRPMKETVAQLCQRKEVGSESLKLPPNSSDAKQSSRFQIVNRCPPLVGFQQPAELANSPPMASTI